MENQKRLYISTSESDAYTGNTKAQVYLSDAAFHTQKAFSDNTPPPSPLLLIYITYTYIYAHNKNLLLPHYVLFPLLRSGQYLLYEVALECCTAPHMTNFQAATFIDA